MTGTATDTSTQDGKQTGGSTSTAGDEFTAITSQEDLNRIIDARLKREREKFGDYKDLQAKAARLDEIEQANQSEIEKATAKVTAAEAEVAKVPEKVASALRDHLVALHKIPADDAELFLTANDPETLLKQVDRLLGREAEAKQTKRQQGNHVRREGGTSTKPAEDGLRSVARSLFGGGDS
jgi:hypothetical protein